MLTIKNLTVGHGADPVLTDFSLEVGSGQICAIIGPSGCGKSTLLGAVAGLLQVQAGDIRLDQESICPKRHVIGLVPQHFGLLPWKSVEENVLTGPRVRGLQTSKKAGHPELDSLLETLKISHLKKRFPSQLSGGQKQRAALARAFLLHPDLLLMDEPFSALDALTREAGQSLFLDLLQTRKPTGILVTHDVEEAVALGSKVVVMSPPPGRIVEVFDCPSGTLDEVRANPEFAKLVAGIRDLMKAWWS